MLKRVPADNDVFFFFSFLVLYLFGDLRGPTIAVC